MRVTVLNKYSVSDAKVNNFMSCLEDTINDIALRELPMHHSPKAFLKGGERNPIMLGWEWERKLKDSIHYGDAAFLTKFFKSPLRLYVNARKEVDDLELVSIPATLEQHKKWMDTFLFKKDIGFSDIIGRGNKDLGVHVHISKDAFTENSLTNFIAFFAIKDNKKFVNTIAGRDIYNSEWCKPYCMVATKDVDGRIVKHNIRFDGNLRLNNRGYEKDTAVNTATSFNTVELRIFKTVNGKKGMYRNLEFTDALTRFCAIRTIDSMNPKEFMKYVKRNKIRYPVLSSDNKLGGY